MNKKFLGIWFALSTTIIGCRILCLVGIPSVVNYPLATSYLMYMLFKVIRKW